MYTTVLISAVLIVLLAGPSSQSVGGHLEETQESVRLPRFAQGGRGGAGAGFTMNDYGFKIIDTGSQYGYESKIPGAQARFVMGVSGGRYVNNGGNRGGNGGGFGGGYNGNY